MRRALAGLALVGCAARSVGDGRWQDARGNVHCPKDLAGLALAGCAARSVGDGRWQDARGRVQCPTDQICMESPSGVVLTATDPRPCQCARPLECDPGMSKQCTVVRDTVLECQCSSAPPPQ